MRIMKSAFKFFYIFRRKAAKISPVFGIAQSAKEEIPCDCIVQFRNHTIQRQLQKFPLVIAHQANRTIRPGINRLNQSSDLCLQRFQRMGDRFFFRIFSRLNM